MEHEQDHDQHPHVQHPHGYDYHGKHRLNPYADCRVRPTAGCKLLSKGKWECGGQQPLPYPDACRPGNTDWGVIEYDPDRGLRVPQRRDFLTPYYWNGGCGPRYCTNADMCPKSILARPGPSAEKLFKYEFQSTDPYGSVSHVPSACTGINCGGPNGAQGWVTVKSKGGHDMPLWKAIRES